MIDFSQWTKTTSCRRCFDHLYQKQKLILSDLDQSKHAGPSLYVKRGPGDFFIAIRENDPSASDNWVGSTILAHWDSKDANNDPVLFESLANNYPEIGCPLAFFNLVTGRDIGTENKNFDGDGVFERAKKAEQAELRAAQKKAEEAAIEFENKRKCIQLEDSSRFLESTVSELTTEPRMMREAAMKTVQTIAAGVFAVGDYVRVSVDLRIGIVSYGGLGFIVDIAPSGQTASVKYGDQDGRSLEKNSVLPNHEGPLWSGASVATYAPACRKQTIS